MSRRRIRPESEVPTSRLGHGDKIRMLNKVDTLLARPINLLKCPLTTEEQATIWNSFQDQRGIEAVRTLQEIKANVSRYKTNQVEFLFDKNETTRRPAYKISFSRREDGGWQNDEDSPFIHFQSVTPSWELFIHRLGNRAGEFVNWVEAVTRIDGRVRDAREIYTKVSNMCSTVGQLCRVVPECSRFVSSAKIEIYGEQKKRSPLPEEWYKLDGPALDDMNNLLSQCQLMPQADRDVQNERHSLYSYITWARIRDIHD